MGSAGGTSSEPRVGTVRSDPYLSSGHAQSEHHSCVVSLCQTSVHWRQGDAASEVKPVTSHHIMSSTTTWELNADFFIPL